MQLKTLTPDISVGPQIQERDLPELARLGFRSIIGNRPEGESPDQPAWLDLKRAAANEGLEAAHIPVVPGKIDDAHVEQFREAVRNLPKPIAAFCRTGTRSAMLWALANLEGISVDERIRAAAEHGFDLEPLRGRMEA